MSATAPWSVKGIDPKAREIAKDLARRSGMTLGEWLNSMIMDEPEEDGSGARRVRADEEAGRSRGGHDRFDALIAEMGERLEVSERRSATAIHGIDQAVSSLMRRMDAERDLDGQNERRLENMARELREGHNRLRLLEERAPSGDLKSRLDEAQNETRSALEALQRSFGALEKRLGQVETRPAFDDGQLAGLADNLRQQIEANRLELIGKLESSSQVAGLQRLDKTLEAMQSQAKASEMRSARAVEAMGHEVMRIARNMNARMEGLQNDAEARTAKLVDERLDGRLAELGRVLDEKLDREIARHTQSVEARLTSQEDQHALALERLGGEITRISDRLSERIAQTERRSNQAIEDIGRRLAENTEKLERRSTDATGELTERLRQSEERTLRLLEEAKATRAKREQSAQVAAPRIAAPVVFDDVPDFIPESSTVALFGSSDEEWLPKLPKAEEYETVTMPEDLTSAVASSDFVQEAGEDEFLTEAATSELPSEPFMVGDDINLFGSLDEDLADDLLVEETLYVEEAPVADEPFGSIFASVQDEASDLDALDAGFGTAPALDSGPTHDLADISPANPFFADFESEEVTAKSNEDEPENGPSETSEQPSSRDYLESARAAIVEDIPEAPRKGFGLTKLRKKGGTSALQKKLDRKAARDGSTFGQALKVSALAMLVVGGGGYGTLKLIKDQNLDLNFAQTPNAPQAATPMAALALDVTPTDAVPSKDVAETEGAAIYNRAMALIESGDASGVEPLGRAAELGYVPAQMRLAAIYSEGALGVAADAVEAREWVRRAAEGGDPRAMQHYATQLYDGVGGARDEAAAVDWMRRSAEAGRVDSQYNVAHLYEKGVQGVRADKVKAFTWYMIAARRGDEQALHAVQRLAPVLNEGQRKQAQETAENFSVQPTA